MDVTRMTQRVDKKEDPASLEKAGKYKCLNENILNQLYLYTSFTSFSNLDFLTIDLRSVLSIPDPSLIRVMSSSDPGCPVQCLSKKLNFWIRLS